MLKIHTSSICVVFGREKGNVVAQGSSHLTKACILVAAESGHVTVACIDRLHDLHWMIIESRREIINDLILIVNVVPTILWVTYNKEIYLPNGLVYRSSFLE